VMKNRKIDAVPILRAFYTHAHPLDFLTVVSYASVRVKNGYMCFSPFSYGSFRIFCLEYVVAGRRAPARPSKSRVTIFKCRVCRVCKPSLQMQSFKLVFGVSAISKALFVVSCSKLTFN
jgi:hypothetical protein